MGILDLGGNRDIDCERFQPPSAERLEADPRAITVAKLFFAPLSFSYKRKRQNNHFNFS